MVVELGRGEDGDDDQVKQQVDARGWDCFVLLSRSTKGLLFFSFFFLMQNATSERDCLPFSFLLSRLASSPMKHFKKISIIIILLIKADRLLNLPTSTKR